MTMDRPRGITILASIILINSILMLVFSPLINLIPGLIGLYVAMGLFKMEEWAWWAALLFNGLNALFMFFMGGWIFLIIDIIVIIYLIRIIGEFQIEDKPIYHDEHQSKDQTLVNIFGKENVKTEYSENRSSYCCPKCDSQDIELMGDGSGFCNQCNNSFMSPAKKA